ncbi:hypothetical protein [Tumebacillus algifaecis]|uniref:hypothetical protein n=1 Tax=Tumebacillus algifaecis TaxID=1214604 RepID=UPI0012FD1D48|nr:hypothetical protein [Tumebacillus algifaecis]
MHQLSSELLQGALDLPGRSGKEAQAALADMSSFENKKRRSVIERRLESSLCSSFSLPDIGQKDRNDEQQNNQKVLSNAQVICYLNQHNR